MRIVSFFSFFKEENGRISRIFAAISKMKYTNNENRLQNLSCALHYPIQKKINKIKKQNKTKNNKKRRVYQKKNKITFS